MPIIAGPFVGELEGDVVGGVCNKEKKNIRCEQEEEMMQILDESVYYI